MPNRISVLLVFVLALAVGGCSSPSQKKVMKRTPADEVRPADRPRGGVSWVQDEEVWRKKELKEYEDAPAYRLLYIRIPREYGCGLLETQSFTDKGLLAYLKSRVIARYVALPERRALAIRGCT